jgi:hypothetical protein
MNPYERTLVDMIQKAARFMAIDRGFVKVDDGKRVHPFAGLLAEGQVF